VEGLELELGLRRQMQRTGVTRRREMGRNIPGRQTRRVIETSWVVWRGTSNWVRKLPGVEVEQGQASRSFTSVGAAISSERASYDRGKKRGHLPAGAGS
jgi:hypothetical protein